MKAARIHQWGQPAQLEDVPKPTPANDEVLVRVQAASVNPVDNMIAAGYLQSMFSTPTTLGTDFAGEVEAVGEGVNHVQPGDAVYGMGTGAGTFAEHAIVKAPGVAHKPRSLDDVHAAAAPLAGLTALQTLFNMAQIQPGERVLIYGAAGGVGIFAVQLAKAHGAHVIAADRADKAGFLRELGADEVVDSEQSGDALEPVDVALDLIGGDFVERSFKALKRGGRYVTPAGQPSEEDAARRGIQAYSTFTQPTVEDLNRLAEQIDAGKVKVFISRTFPLADIQEALAHKQEASTQGKIVVTVA